MARSRNSEQLIIGVGGHVVAINAATGDEIWRTKLKGAMFVTVHQRGSEIYAGANGELFCLSADSGEIIWHNKLKGLGLNVVSFTGGSDAAGMAAIVAAAAAAAAAS